MFSVIIYVALVKYHPFCCSYLGLSWSPAWMYGNVMKTFCAITQHQTMLRSTDPVDFCLNDWGCDVNARRGQMQRHTWGWCDILRSCTSAPCNKADVVCHISTGTPPTASQKNWQLHLNRVPIEWLFQTRNKEIRSTMLRATFNNGRASAKYCVP